MDACEILIVLLFIIMAVVPLAIVMTIVKLINERKMEIQQRNRVCPPICLCWLLGRKEKKFLSAVTVCLYSVSHVVHVLSEHAQC